MLVVGQNKALLVELQYFEGVSVGVSEFGELLEYFGVVVVEDIELSKIESVGDDKTFDGEEVLLLHGVSHLVLAWDAKIAGKDEHNC